MKLIPAGPVAGHPNEACASTATAPLFTPDEWRQKAPEWPQGQAAGVRLPNDHDIENLGDHVHRLSLVALEFPKWTDGRAYSQARLLRSRLRFRGEVRAVGEVLVDMLPLLQRTGFDAAQLRADQKPEAATRILNRFSGHYQGDVLDPRPHFARQEQV